MVTNPKTHGPATAMGEVQALFEDDHVHMALIVATDGKVLTTIERPSLGRPFNAGALAREAGALSARTIRPYRSLDSAMGGLKRAQRHRLAVVDRTGRLVALLCLKRSGDGSVRTRAYVNGPPLLYQPTLRPPWAPWCKTASNPGPTPGAGQGDVAETANALATDVRVRHLGGGWGR